MVCSVNGQDFSLSSFYPFSVFVFLGSGWEAEQLRAVEMLEWAGTSGVWAELRGVHGDVWENHWLIERVFQGPLFTDKAKRWGQASGETFLLDRRAEALFLSS